MKHPSVNLLTMQIEALEDRRLLAGSVTANVVGSTLIVEADAASNDYVISGGTGGLQITSGMDATTISVQGDLNAVKRIQINDLGGNDKLIVSEVTSISSLFIEATGGQKQLKIDQSALGRVKLLFNNGEHLQLDLAGSTITRSVVLTGRQASMTTRMTGTSSVGGNVLARVTGGDNHLSLADTVSVRSLRQMTAGGGDSSTALKDQTRVSGAILARNFEGVSDVQIVDQAAVGRFVGSGFSVQRNVEYVNRDGVSLRADIYTPKSEGPHPAVIAVHGGFWRSGSKARMSGEARELAQRGYVVMSINYRLAPPHPFPSQVHDVKAAISWLKANSVEHDVDPNRIGLWGYSAGAQLALLAGLTDVDDGLEDPDALPGSPATTVQAIVAAAPPTDFRDVDLHSQQFAYLFGGTRAELPDLYAQASPAAYTSAWDPPVYMYMGENDQVVSQSKAAQLAQDLNDVGVEAELHMVPKKNHLSAKRDRPAVYNSLRFLDQQLK